MLPSTQVRKLISDFAIVLAILIFCGVDMLVGVDTPKLIVPTEFKVWSFLVIKHKMFFSVPARKKDNEYRITKTALWSDITTADTTVSVPRVGVL